MSDKVEKPEKIVIETYDHPVTKAQAIIINRHLDQYDSFVKDNMPDFSVLVEELCSKSCFARKTCIKANKNHVVCSKGGILYDALNVFRKRLGVEENS